MSDLIELTSRPPPRSSESTASRASRAIPAAATAASVMTGSRLKQSPTLELCERCDSFDIQAFARNPGRCRGYLLRDVCNGAKAGCEFCMFLQDSIADVEEPKYTYMKVGKFRSKPEPLDQDQYLHMTLSNNYDDKGLEANTEPLRANRLKIEVGARFGGVQRNASAWEVCLAADPDSSAAREGDVSGRYLGRNLASEERCDTIKMWLTDCQKHKKCNETVSGASLTSDTFEVRSGNANEDEDPILPTRCIHIRKNGKGIWLIETGGMRGQYITLTHRWNQETNDCKTTTDNYQARLDGKQIYGALPKLFTDALTIAEKLGIYYVWIDSLCIIQSGDGKKDWIREAPRMAQYYQRSLFTIAGTMDDVSNGILNALPHESFPFGSKLIRLPYRNRMGVRSGIFYVFKRKVAVLDDYQALVSDVALLKRAWILQEWLLSKRLLWYTSGGLIFECNSQPPRTDMQEELPVALAKSDLKARLCLKRAFHNSNNDLLGFWYDAIAVYSKCRITEPDKDRILAIAGLAIEIAQVLYKRGELDLNCTGSYMAGLWLHDICHGLLWEQDGETGLVIETVKQAPSWSWASLLIPVRWPQRDGKGKLQCKILGVYTKQQAAVPDDESSSHTLQENNPLAALPEWTYHAIKPPLIGSRIANASANEPFDPKQIAGRLSVCARVYTIHIRGYLVTEENQRSAALATAYSDIPRSANWRALCDPKKPDLIAGWASPERLENTAGLCSDSGVAVLALHVSTRYVRSGPLIKRHDPVLDILLIEEAHENTFRRLGVGRIFERTLIAEFEKVKERTMVLI